MAPSSATTFRAGEPSAPRAATTAPADADSADAPAAASSAEADSPGDGGSSKFPVLFGAALLAVAAVALLRRRSASASSPEGSLAPRADAPSVDEASAR